VISTYPHYTEHIREIALGVPPDVAVAAGYSDVRTAIRGGYRKIVRMEHGIGQSYTKPHPGYPGGKGHERVGLFLQPNEHAAARWRREYPRARVEVVGSPKLDHLPVRHPPGEPVIAFAFHFDLYLCPETRSALPWFKPAIELVTRTRPVVGHGHPRRTDLGMIYERAGVTFIPSFMDVCRVADVLVADNTSILYEFASTGRPVVVLDAPVYRRDVRHGLRFWDAAHVGVHAQLPEDVPDAISRALELWPEDVAAREAALDLAYGFRSGATERALGFISDWIS
jgi:hypothetical protein